MIQIVIGMLIVFATWIYGRYHMWASPNFMFEFDEIHHWDILLLALLCPFCLELNYPIACALFGLIAVICALDDWYQHYMMQKTGNDEYESPLKKLLRPIWSIPWRLR